MTTCYVCDRPASAKRKAIPYCVTHCPPLEQPPEVAWFASAPPPRPDCKGRHPTPEAKYKVCDNIGDPCRACRCTAERCYC